MLAPIEARKTKDWSYKPLNVKACNFGGRAVMVVLQEVIQDLLSLEYAKCPNP